jgi:hypothetical protein
LRERDTLVNIYNQYLFTRNINLTLSWYLTYKRIISAFSCAFSVFYSFRVASVKHGQPFYLEEKKGLLHFHNLCLMICEDMMSAMIIKVIQEIFYPKANINDVWNEYCHGVFVRYTCPTSYVSNIFNIVLPWTLK